MGIFTVISSLFILLCSIVGIICGFFFTCMIVKYRRCRTTTNLLMLNSTMAALIVNLVCVCQVIYQLSSNELDQLCVFRGYLLQTGCGLLYHTFCVQAIYRLFTTIPKTRHYFQSKRLIVSIVTMQWVISFTSGLPLLLDDRFKFETDHRICHVSMYDLHGFLYILIWIYLLPLSIIIGIYIRVLIYIKQKSFNAGTGQNTLEHQRQQRELRIYCYMTLLIVILIVMPFPDILFFFIAHLTNKTAPSYAQQICLMFISFGHGIILLFCLMHNDDIQKCLNNLKRKLKRRRRQRRVHCISIVYNPREMVRI